MMGAKGSSSAKWRQKGNSVYASVTEAPQYTIKRDRLNQAAQSYQKAFELGKNEDELASAAKNLAMTSWRMVQLMNSSKERSFLDAFMIMYHCKEAFKYFSFSYSHGKTVKSSDWLTGILTNARACWEDVLSNHIDDLEYDVRVQALYDLSQTIEIGCIKAECFLKLAECQFHRGILALQKSDYKKCLTAMHECFMPIAECSRLSRDYHILTEAKVLEADVFLHQCMAESIQARAIGDDLFDKVLLDEETLNIDMVWEVIDWYKQATLRTREVTEMELEAIAVSRIGRVYDRVLKLKNRAKEYYKLAIQLAFTMHPRTFNSEEWYKESAAVIAKYQAEALQAEQEREQLKKQEALIELEPALKKLRENDRFKDDESFLKFVYNTFPPKEEKKWLTLPNSGERDKLKKCLQTAVIHYHPDSVDEEKHGLTWKVLSEEITKIFTHRYEKFKD